MEEVKDQLKTISTHDHELGDSYSFLDKTIRKLLLQGNEPFMVEELQKAVKMRDLEIERLSEELSKVKAELEQVKQDREESA